MNQVSKNASANNTRGERTYLYVTKFAIATVIGLAASTSNAIAAITAQGGDKLTESSRPAGRATNDTRTIVPADLRFDVWMDDKPLGSHDYRFSLEGNLLQVDSSARFNVKVLFVNVFRYDHDARELWNGPCLSAVRSETTTNGEEETLDLQFNADNCAGTYSYWDQLRLQRPELTNAQTGEKEPASWSEPAPAPLPAPSKKTKVDNPPAGIKHYQLTTASAIFLLWYDKHGRSLAMQTTNDGRTITYLNRELR